MVITPARYTLEQRRSSRMSDSVFERGPGEWRVTKEMTDAFDKNGFILVRGLLSKEEIAKVREAVEHGNGVARYAYTHTVGEFTSRMCVWNHPGDDVTGMVARCNRVATTMEKLMGGDEMYHYHSKLMMKDANGGGPWRWHQDYGYWYNNWCLYPDMGTVFIPVDDNTRENGCLQVLAGSHRLGRVDHVHLPDKILEADPERVAEARKLFPLVHAEMKAGDAIFFHCNLLHYSAPNSSPYRRWSLLISFNKRSNSPYKETYHPFYTPLKKVKDEEILKCDVMEQLEGKWFLNPTDEKKYNFEFENSDVSK